MASTSIAMATYNGARYLSEQLESFSRQSIPPDELVVCDDGSTDATIDILNDFAKGVPFPVKIVRNEKNLGYALNFAKAASLCKSDIIFFSDQDDIWHPFKIEVVVEHMRKTGAAAVSHDCDVVNDFRQVILPSYVKYIEKSGLGAWQNIHGCCIAFRRYLIDTFGWPPEGYMPGHDRWVIFLSILISKRSIIPEVLISRRIHDKNVSGIWGGGNNKLRYFLIKIKIPPFTSSEELDLHTAYWAPSSSPSAYSIFLKSTPAGVSRIQLNRAELALKRRQRVKNFVNSDLYKRNYLRILIVIYLFFTLNYRNAHGIHGVLLDILGRRNKFDW